MDRVFVLHALDADDPNVACRVLPLPPPSNVWGAISPFLARLLVNDRWQFGMYGKQNVGNWMGEPGVV